MNGDDKKYYNGMKIVALSIFKKQWEMIVEGNMSEKEYRDMFEVASRHESKIEKSKNQRLWVWL
jgi:hypothetical protein